MASDLTPYDRVPYASAAFPQTHPDHLATVSRIFGLHTPDVASCRVLELGCAGGGNLIPMAFNLPGGEFVGVDLSRHQITDGRTRLDALGLRNIRLEHASIADIDRGWGRFDYIICHGVYSWVEPPVQEAILRVASANLAPNGIAYISYNTYPGWHMREMVRHMMRYHVDQFDDPQEQVQQARAMLAFMASASDGAGAYGQLLASEVERLGRASDAYLYHEHLEQTNAPLYFHQFVERAEAAGLLYLSESAVTEMLTSHLPPAVAETLERISPDILHLEQYLDFVRNRQFRQTLLCHRGAGPRRMLTPEFLHGLLVSSPAVAEYLPVDLTAGTPVRFWSGQRRADATTPATKAAFARLMEVWPEAIPVDALCAAALGKAERWLAGTSPDEVRRGLLGDLFGGVMYGMVTPHTQAPPCTHAPSETPRAHPLSLFQAAYGEVVVNGHHEGVQLEPDAIAVLRLCSGTRPRHEIARALHALGPEEPPEAAPFDLERVDTILATLTRRALLIG